MRLLTSILFFFIFSGSAFAQQSLRLEDLDYSL